MSGVAIRLAGVRMSLPQIAGIVGSFAVLGVIGPRLTLVMLHCVLPDGRWSDLRRAA